MPRAITFPRGFQWGAATSSYQIEGAMLEDGKGPGIWDTFCAKPGAIKNGDRGDASCQHYHLWKRDLAIMKAMGLNAYRFSLSWPRILPQGTGAANPKGLDFYDRLVDALLAAGITPNATLYHWDLPQALQDRGGWQNREIAAWFGEFAAACARRLGDRVRMWATHNEPYCTVEVGHNSEAFAPGLKLPPAGVYQVLHHVHMSHFSGLRALRAASPKPVRVGIVWNIHPAWPDTDTPEDRAAAARYWMHENDWYVVPVLEGRYPVEGTRRRGALAPRVLAGDFDGGAPDWVGLNYYGPSRRAHDAAQPYPHAKGCGNPKGVEVNALDWEVEPSCLEGHLAAFARRYPGVPLYVTENGYATRGMHPDAAGRVRDARRIDYMMGHLRAVRNAMDRGADVRGYYAWSLLDNFEWNQGYGPQFGLVHVDFGTLARTPKDSALWYHDTIAAGGFTDRDRPWTGDLLKDEPFEREKTKD